MLNSYQIQEVKSRYNLAEFVLNDVGFDEFYQKGDDFVGPCPLHEDSTPSFRVNQTRFICFGCNKRGDIYKWLEYRRGMAFGQALAMLTGEEVPEPPTQPKVIVPKKRPLTEIDCAKRLRIFETNSIVLEVFLSKVSDLSGVELAYFRGRQKGDASIGYAPPDLDLVGELGEEFSDRLIEAGLVTINESGEAVTRYRGRIIIPIRMCGYIRGFTGRDSGDIPPSKYRPKYLDPTASCAYAKKAILFNLPSTPNKERLFIVEGPFDALGFKSQGEDSVALMGTAFSKEQMMYINHLGYKQIIICLDNDPPGLEASLKALKSGLLGDVRLALLPTGIKDPDELFSKKLALSSLTIVKSSRLVNGSFTFSMSSGDTPKLDLTEFNEAVKPYVESNVRNGFPHYNVISFVCAAWPYYKPEIMAAEKALITDLTPEGKFKKENIVKFIEAWKKPCREVRKAHVDKLKEEGGNGGEGIRRGSQE